MIDYLQELVRRGRLDSAQVCVFDASMTFTMNKRGFSLEHTYSTDTLAGLYDKDFALKSDLEQLAVDVCRLALSRKEEQNG